MAVNVKHQVIINRLKKQVKLLQSKEQQGRKKLHAALDRVSKLGRVYRKKLEQKVRLMESKIAATRAVVYLKAASDIERQLLRSVERKAKAVAAAAAKIEKMHAAKMAKILSKKGKRASK